MLLAEIQSYVFVLVLFLSLAGQLSVSLRRAVRRDTKVSRPYSSLFGTANTGAVGDDTKEYSDGSTWDPSFQNPSFFPDCLLDLARDASFSVEVALISRISRMRLDVDCRLLHREEHILIWIMLMGGILCGGDETLNSTNAHRRVHIFVDKKFSPFAIASAKQTLLSYGDSYFHPSEAIPFASGSLQELLREGSKLGDPLLSAIAQIRAQGVTMSALEHDRDHPLFAEAAASAAAQNRRLKRSRKGGNGSDHALVSSEDSFLSIIFSPDNLNVLSGTIGNKFADSSMSLSPPSKSQLLESGEIQESASADGTSVIEEVQSLCFHSAIENIPVLLINPVLVATPMKSYGADSPLLLRDFSQVYYLKDDFYTIDGSYSSRTALKIGMIMRAASGLDLFLLEGEGEGERPRSPIKHTAESIAAATADTTTTDSATAVAGRSLRRYTRLHSWPNGVAHDLDDVLADIILRMD